MTKQMIDLDVLYNLLDENLELLTTGYDNAVDILKNKINELAKNDSEKLITIKGLNIPYEIIGTASIRL